MNTDEITGKLIRLIKEVENTESMREAATLMREMADLYDILADIEENK